MSETLILHGMRVVVYPNDHRQGYVHVVGNGCEAVFDLYAPDDEVELRENYGFPSVILGKIAAILNMHLVVLRTSWKKIHETH